MAQWSVYNSLFYNIGHIDQLISAGHFCTMLAMLTMNKAEMFIKAPFKSSQNDREDATKCQTNQGSHWTRKSEKTLKNQVVKESQGTFFAKSQIIFVLNYEKNYLKKK